MANKGNFLNAVWLVISVVLLIQRGEATKFTVGGSKGWSVPPNNTPLYNQWAENLRFQIGDSLLFVYAPASDSVVQVTKEEFNNCTTTSPIAKFSDGHTEFKFNKSGPYYFISGNKDNCEKNEKLVVVVLADRSGSKGSPPSSSASTTAPSPASAPGSEGTTQAPSSEAKPPINGASSLALSFVGSLGVLVGSLVFFLAF